tara:strand:- start:784 stop:1269 length:486 start_codon:yes stop_codon:yes gene_type:complete
MDNLDKLDFDVSYGDRFSAEEPNLIDIYATKEEEPLKEKEDDKFVSFSANLIKCFKSKIKESSAKLRVDSLIDTYKAAEDTYNKDMKYTLSEWCMANVNRFLKIAEGKNFNLENLALNKQEIEKDLEKYNLDLDFNSISELYIETRKEAISHAVASHWMEI